MAKSRFEYVRLYEKDDSLLPNTFLVVRIDGHAFHRFSDAHGFTKPNDAAALDLMDHAARHVFNQLPDVVLAFGESDEYSFLIRRAAQLYRRRESKIVSLIVSHFTSAYVAYWQDHMPRERQLQYPPSFDGRVVMYPSEREVRDYFAWRQADTHINNLYNTTFWALVQQGGQSATEAHKTLEGTFSSDKNEILFKRFGINYSKLEERFRRGSVVIRRRVEEVVEEEAVAAQQQQHRQRQETTTPPPDDPSLERQQTTLSDSQRSPPPDGRPLRQRKAKPLPPFDGTSGQVVVIHEDIIKDGFWNNRPWLLA